LPRRRTKARETAGRRSAHGEPYRGQPSANPFDLLPLRQFVVFVVRAHQRPLTELADLLGLSRDTVHVDLRSAIRTLSEHGEPATERATPAPGRPYPCPDHSGDCPGRCSYLRRWLASFDRAMPVTRRRRERPGLPTLLSVRDGRAWRPPVQPMRLHAALPARTATRSLALGPRLEESRASARARSHAGPIRAARMDLVRHARTVRRSTGARGRARERLSGPFGAGDLPAPSPR